MIDGTWQNSVRPQDMQLNLALPCLASNDRGPVPTSILILAMPRQLWMQVMTEGQHQNTQPGHASLCKQCAIVEWV